jgi:hypothetical protein
MPDHIHFLFTLGPRLSLGQTIIKFKAKTKDAIEATGLEWQRDFFDHRLRAEDAMESFAKYIFLNPYRKGLIMHSESWAHWHLSGKYTPEFAQHLDAGGAPPVEWIVKARGAREMIDADLIFEDQK